MAISSDTQLNIVIFLNNFCSLDKFRDAFIAQQATGTTNHKLMIVFLTASFRHNRSEFLIIYTGSENQRRVSSRQAAFDKKRSVIKILEQHYSTGPSPQNL